MFHRVAENTKDSGQWCEGRKGGGSGHTHTLTLTQTHTPGSNIKQPTDLCHDTQEQGWIEIQDVMYVQQENNNMDKSQR